MKSKEAHQIANRQISCLLDLEKTKVLRTEARMILKGILIAQEKEIEFLETEIKNEGEECALIINNRLEALKLSCQDLRKVLK